MAMNIKNHILFVVDKQTQTVKYYVWDQRYKDDPIHGPYKQDIVVCDPMQQESVHQKVGEILLTFKPTTVSYLVYE